MRLKTVLVLLLALMGLAVMAPATAQENVTTELASTGGSSTTSQASETTDSGTVHTVEMTDGLANEPESITVSVGDTVRWQNTGSIGHSVTAYEDQIPDGAEYFASGGFDSEQVARDAYAAGNPNTGAISGGESYEHTFKTEGEFEYFCIPHEAAGHVGTVVVKEGGDGGGGGGGSSGGRDAGESRLAVSGSPPTLYIGEENLDISTSSTTPDSGSIQVVGTTGEADGNIVTIPDLASVDVLESQGISPGGYRLSSNANPDAVDVTVREASVSEVELYRGSDTSGAEITGGSLPQGDYVTVQADFNFDEVMPGTVVVEDETGTDITGVVASNDLIESSGGTLTLDTSDLDAGDYTITVEGDDDFAPNVDSDLGYASQSVSFTINPSGTSEGPINLSVSNAQASIGSSTTVTVTLSNEGSESETSAGIQHTTTELPQGVTLTDIETDAADGSVTTDSGAVFFLQGMEPGETKQATYTFSIGNETATGQYPLNFTGSFDDGMERSETGSLTVTTGPASAAAAIAMADGTQGTSFQDVLSAISAFNSNEKLSGYSIGFQDVLAAISAFNSG